MSIRIEKMQNGKYKVIRSNPKALQVLKDLHSHNNYVKQFANVLMPMPINKIIIYDLIKSPVHFTKTVIIDKILRSVLMCGVVNTRNNARLRASKNRTKKKIKEILFNNLDNKTYLVTLTFKESIKDYDLAYSIFNDYINNNVKGLKYINVKELQNLTRGGVIHYHLMIFDVNYRIKKKFKNWFQKIGGVHIQKVKHKNVNRLTNYFIGYIYKDDKNQMIHNNKRIFTTSRNLKKSESVGYMYYRYVLSKNKNKNDFNNLEKDLDLNIIDYAKWISKKVNIINDE